MKPQRLIYDLVNDLGYLYGISTSKCPQHRRNFEALGLRRLQEDGAYFKVKEIIPKTFQNLVIFSFQITIDNYHYDRQSLIFQKH